MFANRSWLISIACVLAHASIAQAAEWAHVTTVNNVELTYSTSLESTPAGPQPFIYLRLQNHNPEAVEGAVGVDVTCKSGTQSHVGFGAEVVGIIMPGQVFGGFPHLYKAVCMVGDAVESVEADLRFSLTQATPTMEPPEPMPTWVPDTIPPPPPPPTFPEGSGAPPLTPTHPFNPTHPPSSTGTLVEIRYGLSALAIPVQGVSTNNTGYATNNRTTAGGLGPRLTLDVWPYYSRYFAIGLNGLLELGTIGLSDGFTYAANLAAGLRLQAGDETFLSGVLKIDEGYRGAEASSGSNFDPSQSDAAFGGTLTRFAFDGRLCIDEPNPFGPCRRGVDLGVGYDNLAYAKNYGGWFLEGAFWMRHHFAVSLEYGWSYPSGGLGVSPTSVPYRSNYVSFGLLFSDAFFNGYATR